MKRPSRAACTPPRSSEQLFHAVFCCFSETPLVSITPFSNSPVGGFGEFDIKGNLSFSA